MCGLERRVGEAGRDRGAGRGGRGGERRCRLGRRCSAEGIMGDSVGLIGTDRTDWDCLGLITTNWDWLGLIGTDWG